MKTINNKDIKDIFERLKKPKDKANTVFLKLLTKNRLQTQANPSKKSSGTTPTIAQNLEYVFDLALANLLYLLLYFYYKLLLSVK